MKCPKWLEVWLDRRGRIPAWVRWFLPNAHFCAEMDGMLITDNPEDCFCELCPLEVVEAREKAYEAFLDDADAQRRLFDFLP